MIEIIIPIAPVTKKNSQQIVYKNGRPIIIPSAKYKKYEKECGRFIEPPTVPVKEPVNVQCLYYMPTRRKVDISNLLNSTLDILVHYGVLLDDNRNIVYSVDGSRVFYDKAFPRTEIEITPITEGVELWVKKST